MYQAVSIAKNIGELKGCKFSLLTMSSAKCVEELDDCKLASLTVSSVRPTVTSVSR